MEWPQDSSINMSLLPLPIFIILPFWRSYFAMTWASNVRLDFMDFWKSFATCLNFESGELPNSSSRRNLLFLHLWCCIFSSIVVNSWKASFEYRTENLGTSTYLYGFITSFLWSLAKRTWFALFLFCFDERTHLILSALVVRLDDRNLNQDSKLDSEFRFLQL